MQSTNPSIKVFGVEPEGAADAHASFKAKTLQGHATPPVTVADGLRTTLGGNNFPVIRDHVDDIVLVSDDEIIATMKLMWERMKLVVEPSGATAAAGVITHKLPLKAIAEGSKKAVVNVGVIISGGNVDLDALPWIKH
jgi:threonine dehydratase